MQEQLAFYLPWIWLIAGISWMCWEFRDEWFAFVLPTIFIVVPLIIVIFQAAF